MKFHQLLFLAGTAAMLSACASQKQAVTLQRVGPGPDHPVTAQPGGTLVVYSAYDRFGEPIYYPPHSGYTVTAAGDSKPRQVPNHVDRFDRGPQRVSLPPGEY